MKQWKEENPITYRKMQISNEIRLLRKKIMVAEYGTQDVDINLEEIRNKINELNEEYRNLK